MIDAGTLIDGRYRVLSRIGSGGMADVYLAQDELLGRQIAVKLLHHRFAEDQEFVERFRREASSAAGLSHPNVVSVFDRGEWDGTYYIAMEYLPGRSLKSIVREGPLEPATAVDIVIQVLRAARFAHRRGIIHRDIKPHNVILDEEGRAKVTDFGIARAGASDMTLTGSIMGTAQYLSPEQAQGQAVSEASDIYAVGIVLYELLTGSIPFDGETAVSIAMKQVSAPAPRPSDLNPAVPAELDAIVLQALAKDPRARFSDADQFIAALEQVRGMLPGGAALATSAGMESAPMLLAPALLAAPPTAIADSIRSGPANGETSFVQRPVEEPPPGEPGNRRRRALWVAALLILLALGAGAAVILIERNNDVTVPDVAGLTQVEAAAKLRTAHLYYTFAYLASSTTMQGRVVGTAPPRGTSVPKWHTVKLLISSGPGNVRLPDIASLPKALALAELKKLGLKPKPIDRASSSVPAGRAIETEPAVGAEVKPGAVVKVLISTGPAPVTVPTVTGQSLREARETLTDAGLRVGSISRTPSDEPAGTVLAQSPSEGAVRPNSYVNLTVASRPNEVSVPDVIGENQTSAAAAIAEAGLSPIAKPKRVSEPALNETVVAEIPEPGTKLKRGATVRIRIGVYEEPRIAPVTTTGETNGKSSTTSESTTTTTTTTTATATTGATTPTTTTTTTGVPAGTTGVATTGATATTTGTTPAPATELP